MLNPHTDRLDYGEKLSAPEGFILSHGLATTYTLDLETLLCLPLGHKHWLFSRAEELDLIGAKRLAGWECFALNNILVSGEDELARARVQNLHAKLVLLQNGSTSHWHIGSANATKAALGGPHSPPRNTEFMLRLSSSGTMQSAQQLKNQLAGTEEEPAGFFVSHQFSQILPQEQSANDPELRKLLHRLIKAEFHVIQGRTGKAGGNVRLKKWKVSAIGV